ncbi:helix-turn-helix domain-containing protein [Jeotgalibacillus terrae]|uniref:Helix-turn-helix domain-containing protein n=1 Tax=Jeotgalibacillus terrae TaxID=587735 RepID=A0ABW5ZFD9_9BACL|nr:helix-turn-helix domain-containing protein [Jeotgalibacillus terrae]MBM7577703.1 excisionase family DNA binding protein [Jeotgalibacillus terrae]
MNQQYEFQTSGTIPQLYDIADVAKLFKTNKNTVYELIKAGHLTALKLGRLKVTCYELEDFLRRNNGKDFTDLNNVTELKEEANNGGYHS